jgi:putative DNA primase/helicase
MGSPWPPPTPENTTDFVRYLVEQDDAQNVYDGAGYFAQLPPTDQSSVCDQLAKHFGERLDRIALQAAITRRDTGSSPDPTLNGHKPQRVADWLQDIPEEYRPEAVLTDTGNAARFAEVCAGRVRYVEQWGRWLCWDARRWAEDHEGRVLQYAREAAASIYEEAAEAAARGDKHYAPRLADWAKHSQSDKGLTAMLNQAQSWPGTAATPEQFDAHPWLLNCRNGVVDLRTGTLRQHDPALLITKLVDIDYDPHAKPPRHFLRFLLQIMCGRKSLVRFLQRAIGYSLVGDVSGECFLILYGTGANGKSTLILVLRDLLGDYAINVKPEVLAYQRYQSAAAPTPDVARLRGMRLVTSVETGEGIWLNESLLKQFASREPMTARFLHRDPFDFPPTFLLIISTNHKPNIRGTDQGIWRRTMMIPFDRAFTEAEQDPDLIAKLRAELPGILAWAVRGGLASQHGGLKPPDEVKTATAKYREEMDVLGGFLRDCCMESTTASVPNKDLYPAYQLWCEANHEGQVKNREFCKRLEERGLLSEHGERGKVWRGLALRPEWL